MSSCYRALIKSFISQMMISKTILPHKIYFKANENIIMRQKRKEKIISNIEVEDYKKYKVQNLELR